MSGLDSLRELWIAAARELVEDFNRATPARELGGILGRAGELLETLAVNLDDFAEVQLEGPERDLLEIEERLMTARRIPRCVMAFASELERSEEDRAWAGLRGRAAVLRSALRGFQHILLLQDLGVDLGDSLPDPPLTALARLGRAARLEQLEPFQEEGEVEDGDEDEE
ncbi:MAG: hypothetical protein JKY65_04675 [Planctomycetes bacterium]|nr:hypothetical protein [Planctomycetota bacterium]